MRQILHKAHRVAEDDAGFGGKVEPPRGGVERGEQLVFGEHVGFGEAVEQGGFANFCRKLTAWNGKK